MRTVVVVVDEDYTSVGGPHLKLGHEFFVDPGAGTWRIGDHRTSEVGKLNWRSRGRHAPGSAPYTNRWVFGNSVSTADGVSLAGSWTFETWQPAAQVRPSTHRVVWDRYQYFHAEVENRFLAQEHKNWWVLNIYWRIANGWASSFGWDSQGRITRFTAYPSTKDGRIWLKFQYFYPIGPADEVSPSEALSYLDRAYDGEFDRCCSYSGQLNMLGTSYSPTIPEELRFSQEMKHFDDKVDLLPHSGLDAAMARAFTDAVDGFPNLDGMNNIANGLDLLGLLKSTLAVFVERSPSSVGRAADAWLGYRYAVKTTKGDVQEAVSYMNRLLDLARTSRIRSNGYAQQGEWYIRCSITLETDALAGLRSTLEKYSLALSAYNAWDLVPYSFIVDWFLDVGGLLEKYESRNIAFRVKDRGAWFSIERRWKNEFGFPEIYYHRWFTTPNLAWLGRTSRSTRTVTWLKRTLDAVALFSR